MAWNRSVNNQQTKAKLRRGGAPRPTMAVIVVAAVGVAAGIAAWLLWPCGVTRRDVESAKRDRRIREVTPAVVTNKAETAAPKVVRKYKDFSREEKLKYWQDRYGDNPPENLKAEIYFLKNPPVDRVKIDANTPTRVFKNRSEKIIASALMIEPGAPMVMKPVYGADFDADFAQHAIDSIDIDESDSEETRNLKKAVADTKNELIARVKAGETPSEIMNAHMESMYELGKYKSQMNQLLTELRNDPGKSDDDIRDFVTAANKLLREKGAKEIEMPNLFARQAKLRAAARKAKLKGAKE